MELNSKSLSVLKRLADESTLSDDDFGVMIAAIFDSYTVNINTGAFEINTMDDLETIWKKAAPKKTLLELKEITAAVHMLVVELARHNSDKSSTGYILEIDRQDRRPLNLFKTIFLCIHLQSALLEEYGFNSNRVKLFIDSYQVKKENQTIFLNVNFTTLVIIII